MLAACDSDSSSASVSPIPSCSTSVLKPDTAESPRRRLAFATAHANDLFIRWVEDTCHTREHTSLGMRPIDRFGLDLGRIRHLQQCGFNAELFFLQTTRRVRTDNTFQFKNILEVHARQGGFCLILGEPGTGKSVLKRHILHHDTRRWITPPPVDEGGVPGRGGRPGGPRRAPSLSLFNKNITDKDKNPLGGVFDPLQAGP